MKKDSHKFIGVIVLILAIGVGVAHLYVSVAKQKQAETTAYLETPYESLIELSVANKVRLITADMEGAPLTLAVAYSSYEGARGLSLIDSIDDNQGMLYAYDRDDIFPHSTIGMKFNLDIVWLDADKKVVYLEKNLEPGIVEIMPDTKARYVVELAAGTIDRLNLDISDAVEFTL